jgi:hypothetical protein
MSNRLIRILGAIALGLIIFGFVAVALDPKPSLKQGPATSTSQR